MKLSKRVCRPMLRSVGVRRRWTQWSSGILCAASLVFALVACGPSPNTSGSKREHRHPLAQRQATSESQHHRARAERHARGRHPRQTAAAARVSGIPVSHCDWRTGSSCTALPPPGSCHLRGRLQDPHCNPGALNPAVTQARIDSTICVSGYTDRVRPPTSYTDPLKLRMMAAYGFAGRSTADFELDHLISLELGGAPADARNLFPEPYSPGPGARQKDTVENRLHDEVCSGQISLATAQHEILDWVKYYPVSGSSSSSPTSSAGFRAGSAPRRGASGGSNCTSGYSPCITPGPDVDCAGGGGDGPRYVQGPAKVTGSDPYDLDANGDGIGCS
jgi:hypothetical protein